MSRFSVQDQLSGCAQPLSALDTSTLKCTPLCAGDIQVDVVKPVSVHPEMRISVQDQGM